MENISSSKNSQESRKHLALTKKQGEGERSREGASSSDWVKACASYCRDAGNVHTSIQGQTENVCHGPGERNDEEKC